MNCPQCGAEVIEEAGFCHKCGAQIDETRKEFSAVSEESVPTSAQEDSGVESVPANAEQSPVDATSPQPEPAEMSAAQKLRDVSGGTNTPDAGTEERLWEGGYCSKDMLGAWLLSGVVSITLLVIWGLWVRNTTAWIVMLSLVFLLWLYQWLKMVYRKMNVRYYLTDKRLIHETGILRRTTDRIETIDMSDITFEQSFLNRFVGVGLIRIVSSDRSHPELLLPGIDNVKEIAGRIDDVRLAERRRRGLHIERI